MNPLSPPPFSRPFPVSALRDKGAEIALTANEAERAALAAEDGLVAIAKLEADFRVKREGRYGLNVTGEVRAKITQTCVLSLERFDSDIVTPVAARFDSKREKEEVDFGVEDMDPPEPVIDGKVDLGALAAEFLALALDPYPRKPDAMFAGGDPELPPEKLSPFAGLKEKLRSNNQK